jgi:hypothetical protein
MFVAQCGLNELHNKKYYVEKVAKQDDKLNEILAENEKASADFCDQISALEEVCNNLKNQNEKLQKELDEANDKVWLFEMAIQIAKKNAYSDDGNNDRQKLFEKLYEEETDKVLEFLKQKNNAQG